MQQNCLVDFSSFSCCVYFKYKSCLQAKQVVHKGRKYKRIWKRKENGETKKQAQRNENKEKCKIRNMFENDQKQNKAVIYVHVGVYRHMSLYLTGIISFTTWIMWHIKHNALHTYLKIPCSGQKDFGLFLSVIRSSLSLSLWLVRSISKSIKHSSWASRTEHLTSAPKGVVRLRDKLVRIGWCLVEKLLRN